MWVTERSREDLDCEIVRRQLELQVHLLTALSGGVQTLVKEKGIVEIVVVNVIKYNW